MVSKDAGLDQALRDTLSAHARDWVEFVQLEQWEQSERIRIQREWERENADKLLRLEALKTDFAELQERLTALVQNLTMQKGVKSFLGGSIRTQVRKRPGEYDPEALQSWGRAYIDNLDIPSDKEAKSKLLAYMRKHNPDMLEVNLKHAATMAVETYDTGEKVFPDSPVEPVWYVTEMSADTFRKAMSTLAIEHEFDERQLSAEKDPENGS